MHCYFTESRGFQISSQQHGLLLLSVPLSKPGLAQGTWPLAVNIKQPTSFVEPALPIDDDDDDTAANWGWRLMSKPINGRMGFATGAPFSPGLSSWLGFTVVLVLDLGFDPHVSVHSLRVTALKTARERGSDIIDLQDFAGHADPRTTLTYIRTRDRLSKSPAYVLRY